MLDLKKASAFTDYFAICRSRIRACNCRCGRRALALKQRPSLVVATRAEWILLDYFDFVIHVFQARPRFYALDRLWAAPPHRIPDVAEAAR